MSAFEPPLGVNSLIGQHLVTPAEIARRLDVSPSVVWNWIARHPKLAELVVPLSTRGDKPNFVLWWPQVEACLAELGLPRHARGRPRKPTTTGGAS